jgi:flagellar biosynthetic protein FliR
MDFAIVAKFGLLLVRPGMVVMIAPGIGGAHIPAPVKVGLTVLIAIGLLPSVAVAPGVEGASLALIVAREVAIGFALAFVLRIVIAGAEFAGHLAGFQIGFSYGATIDPQSGVRSTMLATLYGSLATLAFLGINGHHALLRALGASYTGLPIGAGQINESIVASVREMLGLVFVVGVRLAAPVIVVMLIAEIAVGLIARTAPSLNFMVIGYPIRIVAGLFLVAVLVPTIPSVTNSLIGTAVQMALAAAAAFR